MGPSTRSILDAGAYNDPLPGHTYCSAKGISAESIRAEFIPNLKSRQADKRWMRVSAREETGQWEKTMRSISAVDASEL